MKLTKFDTLESLIEFLKARDQLLKLALVLKELNAKRLVGHKSDRLDLIIDWLKALNDVPTMEAKLELKEQANLLKKRNKDLSEIPE
jgi:hypothetical protein